MPECETTQFRPCSDRAIRAVIQAYHELRRSGARESWALESARRVFGYHEPRLSAPTAAAIVRDLVARGAS